MSSNKTFHLRFTLPYVCGIGPASTQAAILGNAENTMFGAGEPDFEIRDLKYEICSTPIDIFNPSTGVASFDAIGGSRRNVAFSSARARTLTQHSLSIGGTFNSKTKANEWDLIAADMPAGPRETWFAMLRELNPATPGMVIRVQHRLQPSDAEPTTHGWMLVSDRAILLDTVYANEAPSSRAIMAFYEKAVCFGDWEGELLLEIKKGKVVLAPPKNKAPKP